MLFLLSATTAAGAAITAAATAATRTTAIFNALEFFNQLIATANQEGSCLGLGGFENNNGLNILAVKGDVQVGNIDISVIESGEDTIQIAGSRSFPRR